MENSTDRQANSKAHDDMETDLNLKIIEITTRIKDYYPQLTRFLEEMPIAVTDETNVEVTLRNLKLYYDSLNTMLNKYTYRSNPIIVINHNLLIRHHG